MREENTNQQQAEAPRVSRVREYMTAKFPDRQFADEDDYENTLYDYLAESDKKIAVGYKKLSATAVGGVSVTTTGREYLVLDSTDTSVGFIL